MAEAKRITAADLELADSSELVPVTTLKEARENVEREMVEQALRKHSGRISAAATDLGVSRPTLYELMDKLGISRGEPGTHGVTESGAKATPEPPKT